MSTWIPKNIAYLCTILVAFLVSAYTYLTYFDSPRIFASRSEDENDASQLLLSSIGSRKPGRRPLICILVLVCSRPSVKRCLDSVFRSRSLTSAPIDFPVIVSQDCGRHPETTQVIESYGKQVHRIFQPDQKDIPVAKGQKVGYYKQTRHTMWALNHSFSALNCSAVITLEDDLDVSPDFLEYFAATYPILVNDTSLYCVTASSLQAMPGRVNASAHELLHRTDFFFGWGWMITGEAFRSLGRWPKRFWDVWMGLPSVRRGRSCIRPEIPRIKNFGRDGVSGHEFYDTRVKDLLNNDKFVPFTSMNLSYLEKENYRIYLQDQLKKSIEIKDLEKFTRDLEANKFPPEATFSIPYTEPPAFKSTAKYFQMYGDTWNGIAHTVYDGVLAFMYRNRRIYLKPDKSWLGYEYFGRFDK